MPTQHNTANNNPSILVQTSHLGFVRVGGLHACCEPLRCVGPIAYHSELLEVTKITLSWGS